MAAAAEHAEIAGMRDLFEAVPSSLAARCGIHAREVGGVVCTAVSAFPGLLLLNRALGVGLEAPATGSDLDDIGACFRRIATPCMVSLAPSARPPELRSWLEQRGFALGYARHCFVALTRLVTETCERTEDRPSASYRNILRAGFAECYLRPNFVSPQALSEEARPS